jgi:uncharacterized protein (TIGR00661 family)
MARIYYGVSGEGRGHATRVRTMVEALRPSDDIVVYAAGHAYDLLEPVYRHTEVAVRRIPGIGFRYTSCRRVQYRRTAAAAIHYVANMPRLVRTLIRDFERESPDLVITDFEPALPRAAERAGVPFISLDHQHFLVVTDLSDLPVDLRRHALFMGKVVRAFYTGQDRTIVSSFFSPPLKPSASNVSQVGVLLRPEILAARPENGEHIVAYVRRHASPRLMQALAECGRVVHLYGLGARPREGRIRFREVNLHGFVEDLATGRALVTTAGNQVIGEALHLKKPVFAIPERNNQEQRINACLLDMSGLGMTADMDAVDTRHLRTFLRRGDRLRARIARRRHFGNAAALAAIRQHLPAPPSGAALPRAHDGVAA